MTGIIYNCFLQLAVCIFKIIHSKLTEIPSGSVVWGIGPWAKYAVITKANVFANISTYPKEIHQAFLHNLGIAGLTAYYGLVHIGTPKDGETVVVSSASSTVAGIVAAIAKIKNLRVVGLTHSADRVEELKKSGNFDAIIVSKTDTKALSSALKEAAPKVNKINNED